MSKVAKSFFKIIFSLFLLTFVLIGAAIYFVDPNDYKDQIQSLVKEHTQQEIIIAGELKLRFFPKTRD